MLIPFLTKTVQDLILNLNNYVEALYNLISVWAKDTSTKSTFLAAISEPHFQIHQHHSFVYADQTRNIGAATTLDLFHIKALNNPHLTYLFFFERSGIRVDLYEGSTYSIAGIPVTFLDRNRKNSVAHASECFLLPTVSVIGRIIYRRHYFSSVSTELNFREHEEFVLREDEDYLIRLVNTSTSAINYQIIINFYEANL